MTINNMQINIENNLDALSLRITEIFYSLQGESSFVGLPTIFIRLTGCPLRCGYCDTAYAFKGGQNKSFTNILANIKAYNTKYITITGGEPLAQKQSHDLMQHLSDLGYILSIETSGALDISKIDNRVKIVMDIKTPESKESHKNMLSNLSYLKSNDEIKFVICSRSDYLWSKDFIEQHNLVGKSSILFSPCNGMIKEHDLANWILQDQLQVRFQFQLHKYLWGNVKGK